MLVERPTCVMLMIVVAFALGVRGTEVRLIITDQRFSRRRTLGWEYINRTLTSAVCAARVNQWMMYTGQGISGGSPI